MKKYYIIRGAYMEKWQNPEDVAFHFINEFTSVVGAAMGLYGIGMLDNPFDISEENIKFIFSQKKTFLARCERNTDGIKFRLSIEER